MLRRFLLWSGLAFLVIFGFSLAIPSVNHAPVEAREAVLRENLYQMRSSINQYRQDHGLHPEDLEDLVDAGYLRFMPMDPILKAGRWKEIRSIDGRLIDVRSCNDGRAADGSKYSAW